MKPIFQLRGLAGAAALSLGLLAGSGAQATPVLSITPATQTASVGDTVTVAVGISGLSGTNPGQIVSAFDLNVLFDVGLVAQSGLAIFQASALMGGADVFFDTIGTGPGNAAGNAFSLLTDAELAALQGDAFTLFTVSFQALNEGAAFLNFGASPLFERLVVGRNGQALQLDYAGACIAIGANADCRNTVPEPAGFGLVALALLAAGLARRTARV